MSRQDTAERLLAAAVRLLPPPSRDWGAAMLAELSGIEAPRERWRFAAGCIQAVATRPAVVRRAVSALLPAALVALVVQWSTTVDYAPRRWGLVALAATLAVVATLGQVGPLGPVGQSRTARLVRAAAYLLVGPLALEAALFMAHQPNDDLAGVPVFTVLFTGYLTGALAMTAHHSAATPRALITGLAAGAAAAAAWTAKVLLAPPIPPHAALAVVLAALGMAAAALAASRYGDTATARLAALSAGTTAVLLILNMVTLLSTLGPARLIPHLAPPALGPAEQVANSRTEVHDGYLWLLLLGCLIALVQSTVSLAARSHALTPTDSPVPDGR